ncbi:MAG TPA: NADH-quinone oxidoreductase subunit L [Cytophagaceae bacterium]|nr:NADH-quinone oxidoreductase subunit L [Cytophagaceae bacterium]
MISLETILTLQNVFIALLILLLPMGTFGVLYFFGSKLPRKGDWLATGVMGICLGLSVFLLTKTWNLPETVAQIPWFTLPGLQRDIPFLISIALNPLAAVMMVVVTLISFLVHLYSIEYMYDKKNYTRYFPYLGLFTSSMIGIVLSDNLLVTFMCWELVGFASYLLIGFWMEKPAAARASKKAFLINRIGDVGFLVGLFIVYAKFGTFDLAELREFLAYTGISEQLIFTIAGLGIFLGCVGKSAQFPLQLWLPDAMEGPTPASALIHAATMVAAGIYLLAKTYLLLTGDALLVIAFTGTLTALLGALPAIVQTDIKKVLAYSTISQLGFMVMAMGVQAYDAALFHLITHAFFKACLFLTAGAVIHEMHHVKQGMFIRGYFNNFDTLNMKLMGGLRKKMPVTFAAYFISCMALIGVPFFSGFLSKDAILEGTMQWALHHYKTSGQTFYFLIPVTAILTVSVTAYYMIRQMILVFFGEFKLKTFYPQVEPVFQKIHDPGWLMKIPMVVLGTLSVWIFFSVNPLSGHHGWLMEKLAYVSPIVPQLDALVALLVSVLAVLAGASLAWYRFRPATYLIQSDTDHSFVKRLLKNNWYMDQLYQVILIKPGMQLAVLSAWVDRTIIDGLIHTIAYAGVLFSYFVSFIDKYLLDGIVNLGAWISLRIGRFSRSFQQGNVQGYFAYAVLGVVLVFLYLLIIEF